MEARLPQSRSTSLGSTPRSTSRLLLLDSPRTRRLRLEFAGTPDVMSRPALLALAGAGLFLAAPPAHLLVTLLPPMIRRGRPAHQPFQPAAPLRPGFPGRSALAPPFL